MKKKILAGNWKMNFGPKATQEFISGLIAQPKSSARMRLYVPYVSLSSALQTTAHEAHAWIEVGAQNIHAEKSGAFTGEVSGPMLAEIGVQQVLIGHSERRQYFNETNESVLKKVESACAQGFEVLLCIGETIAERTSDITEQVLSAQLIPLLKSDLIAKQFGSRIHIAYEPVWAIGTGVVATPAQAEAAHAYIRHLLQQHVGQDIAQKTCLLYGGSVAPNNFKDLLACPNIEGGLVGGSSLKLDAWQSLWNAV